MPSFSGFLKNSRRESTQLDSQDGHAFVNLNNDGTEKAKQKKSKRNFFRSLLKRSSTNSGDKRRSSQYATSSNIQSIKSPATPTSPMPDPNKPLPPPPTSTAAPEPASTRPVKNLERIISSITTADLHKLFSGAPQFFARSEGHHTGAPHPSVAFPWDIEVNIRDLTDHNQIHDEAWSSVTAWPHITRDIQRNVGAIQERNEKHRAHYLPRCRERPNMLSMQGIERGTIGYAAALELEVADALTVHSLPEEGPEPLPERRKKFLIGKSGVRNLKDATLLDCLRDVSTTYHEAPLKHRSPTVELYTYLFTKILFPPSRVTDSADPYSLQVQIEALVEVLGAKDVWVDFSLVEWRIKLGQILWGPPSEHESEDEIMINNEVVHEPGSQKYWILLQILLSCELLLRLDAVAMNADNGLGDPKPDEISRFEKLATISVRWSIILARYWLENIELVKTSLDTPVKKTPATSAGWMASFSESLTGAVNSRNISEAEETLENVQFKGRHQERQLKGLLHFARKLKWPDLDALESQVLSIGVKFSDTAYSTPSSGTPLSNIRANSYFPDPRPGIKRGISRSQTMSALIHPAGWISNSYISGLILPGEALAHFLISTLLEHDNVAVSKIGCHANLYGGFAYSDRSFWSTACVLGRVLAAGKGSTECMGWISSEVLPRGAGETWVDIEVERSSPIGSDKSKRARIWHKARIEHDGNVIGGADTSSVLSGDFIFPSEDCMHSSQALAIKLESLDLFAAADSIHTNTPTQENPTPLSEVSDAPTIQSYSAMMRFSVDVDGGEKKEISIELKHEVNFVTAFPCVTSNHTELLKSPTSPSFHSPPQSPTESSRDYKGHPLHKAFTYSRIPLFSLLSSSRNYTFESLLSPPQSPKAASPVPDPTHSSTHTTNSNIPKVLVIDCIDSTAVAFPTRPAPSPHLGGAKHEFGSDMEMLARALCAERGWNALVSRRGRGCLACSIREASALGWRVVLRLA